jgi:hypothetical protein
MGKGSEHSFFLQVVSELMPRIGSRHEVDEDVTKRVAENLEQVICLNKVKLDYPGLGWVSLVKFSWLG